MLATVYNLDENQPISSCSRKRKTSVPQRSLLVSNKLSDDDKFIQGIVNLDVYSIYAENPEKLLKVRPLESSKRASSKSCFDANTPSPTQSTTSCQPLASPLISSGIIDMSAFKVKFNIHRS